MWKYNNTTEYNTNNDEIYHWGILGMKWGHRKNSINFLKSKHHNTSEDYRRAQYLKKKGYKKLSNNELKEYSNRIELERKFKNSKTNYIKSGIAIFGTVAGTIGSINVIRNQGPELINAGKNIIKKYISKK